MATWNDLTGYVRSKYRVMDERADMMKLGFQLGDRSQVVILQRSTLEQGNEEWALVSSAFARLGSVDLQQVLQEVATMVCGGVCIAGDVLTIRHAVPLATLDIDEFERPVFLVTLAADHLEKRFGTHDTF